MQIFKSVQYPAPVRSSGKVGKTHSVCSVGDPNLGVFTIDEIALKNANAVPPTYYFSESPNATYVDLRRHRPSGTPLTWFARLACRQSLSRGVRRIAGRTMPDQLGALRRNHSAWLVSSRLDAYSAAWALGPASGNIPIARL